MTVTHKNRSRRKANNQRRVEAARRQTPLSPADQAERAEVNRFAQEKCYPVPPAYRPAHNASQPEQPLCYWTWRDHADAKRKGRPVPDEPSITIVSGAPKLPVRKDGTIGVPDDARAA